MSVSAHSYQGTSRVAIKIQYYDKEVTYLIFLSIFSRFGFGSFRPLLFRMLILT